jgi:Ser/Thr protein kinase RdoA (MazF antagonist)
MSDPVPQPVRPQVGPTHEDPHRERFDAHELAMVLSHYDLGVIESLRVFPRGSRRSPKVKIKSRRGEYLLKRRAAGHDDPYRVAFAHDLQLHLARCGFPVPGLIGTRDDNNSMLQFNGRTYEVFNYVHGARYERSPAAALEVGRVLGRLHRLMANYASRYEPPTGSFHAAPEVDAKMALIPAAVASVEPRVDRAAVADTAEFLRQAYHEAAGRVEGLGYPRWKRAILHGDWHPGNLLFRDKAIVGVLDFDSARIEPRIIDLANAGLQFSLQIGEADNPGTWPEGLDAGLMRTVVRGYDQTSGEPLSNAERSAIPWLIIEDLIVESMVPIAATGSFARVPGSSFLGMVERKVRWLRPKAARFSEVLSDAAQAAAAGRAADPIVGEVAKE